jgi:hypothetical protein
MAETFPTIVSTVLDTTDARTLAEFWRRLVGYEYRTGDEPPPPGEPDPRGADWLVLAHPDGTHRRLAFQQVDAVAAPTWPDAAVPQQLHLDLAVATADELHAQRRRVLDLGGTELEDRSADPDEPLFVFADPAGHPFCIFVSPA